MQLDIRRNLLNSPCFYLIGNVRLRYYFRFINQFLSQRVIVRKEAAIG
jgi:hypothetical protein